MNKTKLTENLRTKISDHLTNILLLLGKLDSAYKMSNLPFILRQLLPYISRLEMIEKTHEDFAKEFRENILVRAHHSKVFKIPKSFHDDPTLTGLRAAVFELIDPKIKIYCRELKNEVKTEMDSGEPSRIKYLFLVRTIKDSKFISALCSEKNVARLDKLVRLCEIELSKLD